MGDEVAVVEAIDPGSMTAAQVDAFMDKGELPTAGEPEVEAGQPDAESNADEAGAAQTDDEPEEGVEPTAKQEPAKHLGRQERRNIRLNDEVKNLRAEVERLRTERTTQQQNATPQEAKTTRKPAPKYKDFETKYGAEKAWDLYEEAREQHDAEQRKLDLQDILKSERETLTAQQRETDQVRAVEKSGKDLADKINKHLKPMKAEAQQDFIECFQEVTEGTQSHPHLANAITDSDVSIQLIGYFGDKPEELERLKGLSESSALRELGKLEVKLQAPAPKTKTGVKRGASDIGGRGGSSDLEDQISEALARGDNKTADRLMDQMDKQAAGR